MKILEGISYNKELLLDKNYVYNNYEQRLYLAKTHFNSNNKDQYFLKSYIRVNDKLICQGYIYFYLDFLTKESKFIGLYVKDEYRNNGLASFLTASWVKLCLDNGIFNLQTNKKQRKPFLLYLLKKYSFELKEKSEYLKSFYTIHICQNLNDNNKYLMFENKKQEHDFLNSSFIKEDNYQIIQNLDENIIMLDDVILSRLYYIQDDNYAYNKSLQTIDKHR